MGGVFYLPTIRIYFSVVGIFPWGGRGCISPRRAGISPGRACAFPRAGRVHFPGPGGRISPGRISPACVRSLVCARASMRGCARSASALACVGASVPALACVGAASRGRSHAWALACTLARLAGRHSGRACWLRHSGPIGATVSLRSRLKVTFGEGRAGAERAGLIGPQGADG
jgi:hypothetical protein